MTMASNHTTKIELTETQAKLFIKFQERAAFMELLESLGVFNMRSGSIQLTINFDAEGRIGSVATQTTQHYRL